MRPVNRKMILVFVMLLAHSALSLAATIRGRLVCNGGQSPAIGIAVTVFNAQIGRSAPFFTGGDGMYYLNGIPAGQYTLEIWLYRQSPTPTNAYHINVFEPMTDIPPIFLPVCYAQ